MPINPERRRLLLGSVGAATVATLGLPAAADAAVDLHIELHAEPAEVQLRAGAAKRVWRLRGKLLRGLPQAMQLSAGGYLGPVIRVRRGQRVRTDLFNALPESTIVHWHGLHVPEAVDGHPRFAIEPGARFRYEFTVENRAGSYWFHPHPHGRTGKQIYAGMAGLFLVSDDEEAALGLPDGVQDLPLVIQDRNFDDDNQFVYLGDESAARSGTDDGMMGDREGGGGMGGGMIGSGMGGGMMGRGGMGSMMERMMGVLGRHILVNGQLPASRKVEPRAYRLRLLNASNMRILKLAWSDGTPLTVIATGGGLLGVPLQRDYVMLPPADRVELWVDFAKWAPGTGPVLRSLAFDGSMGSMGGMMSAGAALPDGAAFDIQRFDIDSGKAGHADVLPATLSRVDPPQPQRAVNAGKPKVFEITMGMMKWGINGASFEMQGVSALETVKLETMELWEFSNDGGSMMGMVMAHSMHVHGLQFRVISREVSRRFANTYATVDAGHVDAGWKDTVLVMPGERVRILLHFTDYPGLFLYHCHMLEHEDSGLMRNYLVKA